MFELLFPYTPNGHGIPEGQTIILLYISLCNMRFNAQADIFHLWDGVFLIIKFIPTNPS